MSIFRRRRSEDSSGAPGTEGTAAETTAAGTTAAETTADVAQQDAPETEQAAEAGSSFDRSSGPFDVSEVEGRGERLALGAVWLPGREGMEIRMEIQEESQRPIALIVGLAGSQVQLQVFAAPRTLGVWDEIRAEIAESAVAQGGSVDEVDGTFGRELVARLPVRTSDGRTGHQPTRFVGIDGPRWFLRAVFVGPAAHDPAAAEPLESVLRDVVVVRGSEAMAPREVLFFELPQLPPAPGEGGEPGAEQPEGEPAAEAPEGGRDPLQPFERGPEITEVR
ncbi:uncharacterized protein DUF3710 [Kineococcus xinjiangensis]|uniref:Uncharacterized protein DUF3710 n=1 Tax=Kineococcus xinjiangensis TaxID=512762 RepID=A0A2S6IVQ4_9ACTN|nr:DUF3710 domain-containing protein [Kineococcus xinjiangensis]PPK98375.1 uncharacterized protein DUF3710 [Kineococcus xinjiangensis]